MQEEQNVKSLFQHRIRDVVLFSHMVHHVQETNGKKLVARWNHRIIKNSRSCVAEMGRRGDKLSPLTNSVCHAGATPVNVRCMRVG